MKNKKHLILLLLIIAILFILKSAYSWYFIKKNITLILKENNIILKDDYKITEANTSSYDNSFILKTSKEDFTLNSNLIRKSVSFKKIYGATNQLLMANRSKLDTINYETEKHIEREYYTKEEQILGNHFFIQLNKEMNTIKLLGIYE